MEKVKFILKMEEYMNQHGLMDIMKSISLIKEHYSLLYLQKIEKMYDGVVGSDVTLKLDNTDKPENKIAEVRLKIRGNDLMASKQCKTFEEASDMAIDALKKQLEKVKDKK